ncbi:hypothetical protein QBC42DRAFT_318685 [Cladorrhinum samala]|uniref:Aminoglycoside phosphotransferase domain-containing protein n=1 Tax=Cladorrhinum samala TaxID=585594 RepID=A0AAV9H9N5_9PEZI|nr:hypothetical protein QBC42DRAFT_318685 [Cladorrhinum samala]
MSEANTMRFVRDRTSIPIPEVYNAYVDDKPGQVRVIMEFVEGTPLEKAWPEFFPEQKELSGSYPEYWGYCKAPWWPP